MMVCFFFNIPCLSLDDNHSLQRGKKFHYKKVPPKEPIPTWNDIT